jgi:hypothetical protein
MYCGKQWVAKRACVEWSAWCATTGGSIMAATMVQCDKDGMHAKSVQACGYSGKKNQHQHNGMFQAIGFTG